MNPPYLVKIRMIESVHIERGIINSDWEKEGYYYESPRIGRSFRLFDSDGRIKFDTTPVTEVLDGNLFKTMNSTYELY